MNSEDWDSRELEDRLAGLVIVSMLILPICWMLVKLADVSDWIRGDQRRNQ